MEAHKPLKPVENTSTHRILEAARIVVHRRIDEALHDWRRLERCASSWPEQTLAWLTPWIRTQSHLKPLIAVATHADERPLMLLPLHIENQLGLRSARFMGGALSPRHAPLVADLLDEKSARRVLYQLWKHLLEHSPADVISLERVSATIGSIANPLHSRRCASTTHFSVPRHASGYGVRLPHDWSIDMDMGINGHASLLRLAIHWLSQASRDKEQKTGLERCSQTEEILQMRADGATRPFLAALYHNTRPVCVAWGMIVRTQLHLMLQATNPEAAMPTAMPILNSAINAWCLDNRLGLSDLAPFSNATQSQLSGHIEALTLRGQLYAEPARTTDCLRHALNQLLTSHGMVQKVRRCARQRLTN